MVGLYRLKDSNPIRLASSSNSSKLVEADILTKMSMSASFFNQVPFANDPPRTIDTTLEDLYEVMSALVCSAIVFSFLASKDEGLHRFIALEIVSLISLISLHAPQKYQNRLGHAE